MDTTRIRFIITSYRIIIECPWDYYKPAAHDVKTDYYKPTGKVL